MDTKGQIQRVSLVQGFSLGVLGVLRVDKPHNNPVRSSIPSMTFMFWTACPDAPLSKLSITDTRMTRPDGSIRQPISQKFVCATCLISGSDAPTSRTNVAPA